MNIPATINSLKLLYNPSLFLPHVTISNFNELQIPVEILGSKIKVVILDKDNCFAKPHSDEVYPDYRKTFAKLRDSYPGNRLLIVSNTAGSEDDKGFKLADSLEQKVGVHVFRHNSKKPACHGQIMDYLKSNKLVESPDQVVIVGDRLLTDVAMANMMGSYAIWVRDGVVPSTSVFTGFEKRYEQIMKRYGVKPPLP